MHRHRLALGHAGDDFALELGLAAHVDVAGRRRPPGRAPAARFSAPPAARLSWRRPSWRRLFVAGAACRFGRRRRLAVDAGADVAAGAAAGVSIGAAGGGLVACCASKLVESIAPRINQQFLFITQHSRDLISGSVNVRHLPGFSSPSLIFPICIRCNRFTVRPCDSNSRRTSRFLPSRQFQFHHALRLARRNQPRLFRLQLLALMKHAARELAQHLCRPPGPSTVTTYFLRTP